MSGGKRVRWLPIEGYEGLYEVSDSGAVRSLDRKTRNKRGIFTTYHSRTLKPVKTKVGYCTVDLCKNGAVKRFLVHRIVAKTFLPAVDGKEHVNHLDGDRLNNNATNLEWCTPKENSAHAYRDGRFLQTHCSRGHLFTADTIAYSNKGRHCRLCSNYRQKIRNRLKKSLARSGEAQLKAKLKEEL